MERPVSLLLAPGPCHRAQQPVLRRVVPVVLAMATTLRSGYVRLGRAEPGRSFTPAWRRPPALRARLDSSAVTPQATAVAVGEQDLQAVGLDVLPARRRGGAEHRLDCSSALQPTRRTPISGALLARTMTWEAQPAPIAGGIKPSVPSLPQNRAGRQSPNGFVASSIYPRCWPVPTS